MDRAMFYRFLRKRNRCFIQNFMLLSVQNDEANGGTVANNTESGEKFSAKRVGTKKEYVAMIEKKVYTTPRNTDYEMIYLTEKK